MCFSENISLAIGITGLLTSLYFYKKNIYASIGIGYLALMEVIQFFQYKVVNQCDNNYNKFLTNIGYLHICFQPLFFNVWLFAFTTNPNFTFLYLSFFAGLLLASRLFFVENGNLCDTKNEPICGEKTCSFNGERHIAWNVRLRASTWFTPTIALHFFMWVFPVLTTLQLKPILAMLLTGPYFALLTNNIHEQPAIWCYTGISQILLTHFLIR